MTEAIISGLPKLRIEECAARQQARIDSGAQAIVGVNKYVDAGGEQQPHEMEVRSIDNTAVLAKQLERLKVRAWCGEGQGQAAARASVQQALAGCSTAAPPHTCAGPPPLLIVPRAQRLRETRDEAAVQASLAALTAGARLPQAPTTPNLLALAIEAARVRATVGEISSALESEWGRFESGGERGVPAAR